MRCELAVTVSGNHRLQYAMTKLLACARGAGSYFCRVRFVLLSRAHGLSRGWALEGMYQVTGDWQCGGQSWRGDLAIFERYAFLTNCYLIC